MRFGIRLGPFWASTSTRRKPRQSRQGSSQTNSFHGIVFDENGKQHPCHHNHRTRDAAEECSRRTNRARNEAIRAAEAARLGRMSPEEYRQHLMDKDPEWAAQVRQREARTKAAAEAELQKIKDELADGESGT